MAYHSTREDLTYEQVSERMGNRKALTLCNNTTAERPGRFGGREILVRLHGHHIATLWPSGAVEVTDCDGWRSVTTKSRLNCLLWSTRARIRQAEGRWWISWDNTNGTSRLDVPFEPGWCFSATQFPFRTGFGRAAE